MKEIYKYLSNEKGNAYIFVLIIILSVGITMSIIMNVVNYNFGLTEVYKENAYLYEQAVNGVGHAVYRMNNTLDENRLYISEQTTLEIVQNIDENIYYKIENIQNKYDGTFYLGSTYSRRFERNAREELQLGSYRYQLADENRTFEIGTRVSLDTELTITSRATDLSNGNFREVLAVVQLVDSEEESIVPNYRWRVTPRWANYAVFANGRVTIEEIENETSFITVSYSEYENLRSYKGAFTENIEWSIGNPILISDEIVSIDVSRFYEEQTPINTAIIINSPYEVLIYSSDASRNTFNGIIYSSGSILIDGINVNGCVLSEGNVRIMNNSNSEIRLTRSENLVFGIKFMEEELRRRFYDCLGITNFRGISKETTEGKEAIQEILNYSAFTDNATIIIDAINSMYYRVVELF